VIIERYFLIKRPRCSILNNGLFIGHESDNIDFQYDHEAHLFLPLTNDRQAPGLVCATSTIKIAAKKIEWSQVHDLRETRMWFHTSLVKQPWARSRVVW
jgi:hypothetical protein